MASQGRRASSARMLLSARDVHKRYETPQGPLQVLDGASLTMAAGETVALTGESGSGKSTLLHLIAGLDDFESGTIEVEGTAVEALDDAGRAALRRERIGLIFQQFNLVPSLTVGANLRLQARLAGRCDEAWCDALAGRLEIDRLQDRYPEQLSGGQQQRVAIARALAPRPRLVLADEPTGNLDEATGDAVIALTLELVAETGCGFLMVTHSPRLAGALSRQVHLRGGLLSEIGRAA